MGAFDIASVSVWKLLALDDPDLEQADLVVANLAVAKGIESLKNLDIAHYCQVVDDWTARFRRWLPANEFQFRRSPQTYHNDIRFFRAGQLQHFLCHEIGVEYKPERKAVEVYYTNPSDLFLNGLIDTKIGTCGNMAALHVAICRRLGWPVSLTCVKNHHVSRFEEGPVAVNIECTAKIPNGFSGGSDEDYLKRENLPSLAKTCGSDLRKLSMREMLGLFISLRARHYQDIWRFDLCDVECGLARALLPTNRCLYGHGIRIAHRTRQAALLPRRDWPPQTAICVVGWELCASIRVCRE